MAVSLKRAKHHSIGLGPFLLQNTFVPSRYGDMVGRMSVWLTRTRYPALGKEQKLKVRFNAARHCAPPRLISEPRKSAEACRCPGVAELAAAGAGAAPLPPCCACGEAR